MVNLNESDKRVNEDRKKDDLNKVKEVLEMIAPGSTQQISITIRLGQLTGKKTRLLKINVGSVENTLHILKNEKRLYEGIAIKNKIYINADLTKKRKQQKVFRDEVNIYKHSDEIDQRIKYRTMRIAKRAYTSNLKERMCLVAQIGPIRTALSVCENSISATKIFYLMEI